MIYTPANLDSENAIVNSVFSDNSIVPDICNDFDLFEDSNNKKLIKLFGYLYEQGENINIDLIMSFYKSRKLKISTKKLSELSEITINTKHHLQILKDLSLRRKIEKFHLFTADSLQEQNVKLLQERIDSAWSAIQTNHSSNELVESKEILPDTFNFINDLKSGKAKKGILTGYPKLDYLTYGFQLGNYIIIAARTSAGKTTFALNISSNQAIKFNIKVGFISLEMSITDLQMKLISNLSNIPLSRIKTGKISDHEMEIITKTHEQLYTDKMIFYRASDTSLFNIKSKIRQMARRGCQAVYIDYLTLVSLSDSNMSRPERVGIISQELKQLAEDLNITIVALSQLNRNAASGEPSLADIRQSGEIEEQADLILLIHRELGFSDTEIIIAKNRQGALGKIKMHFDLEVQRLTEV